MDATRQQHDAARGAYWEDPSGSLAIAVRFQDEPALRGRALALQGAVLLHRAPGATASSPERRRHRTSTAAG